VTAIRYVIGPCALGSSLVAATCRGLCAVLLGDERDELLCELKRRFPRAELTCGGAGVEALYVRVRALIGQPKRAVRLPLDLHGTAFQQRVWAALALVPAGTTTTYSQLAASIGQPKAARAVARACADNPVAVAIPCHRVIRSDGALSGYRWGVDRKRQLLAREISANRYSASSPLIHGTSG
jgi:AraC family transcriptional regulator of adaptative response/methylated-DNA-[protein]-cysteine methyltransferase